MKNSKLKGLVSNSKLPIPTKGMISLDAELIRTVKGGRVPSAKNTGCVNGVCW